MTRWFLGALLVAAGLVTGVSAQQTTSEAELQQLVPDAEMASEIPGLTLEQSDPVPQPDPNAEYLGRLSTNPSLPDSTANQYGQFGSPYANSIKNPYSRYGSRYSPNGVTNPYATKTSRLYGQDGTYLGKLSTNRYDPDSVSNPFGRYGSRFSPDSINNPFGRFGSKFSPYSPANPYATEPPVVVGQPQ